MAHWKDTGDGFWELEEAGKRILKACAWPERTVRRWIR